MSEESNKSKWETRYSLINRVKDPNDQESWKEFINHYEQYIYNILRRFNVYPSDAEELCQEIVLKLWKALPDFQLEKDKGKFRTWLGTIIRNVATDYIRRIRRQSKLLEDNNAHVIETLINSDKDTTIENVIEDEWLVYISDKAWNHVKKRFKGNVQKVYLLFNEGKSAEEIAEICNLPKRTVYTYKQRIKLSLEEEIEKLNDRFA